MKMRNMPQHDGNTANFLKGLADWISVLDLERMIRGKGVRMIVAMNLRQNRRKSCEGIYHGKHGNFSSNSTVNTQVQGRKGIGVKKRWELNF